MYNVLIIERDDFTAEILSDCLKTLNYIPLIYNPSLSFKDNISTFKPMAIIFNLTLFQNSNYLPYQLSAVRYQQSALRNQLSAFRLIPEILCDH